MDNKQLTQLGAILYRRLNESDWEEILRLAGLSDYLYDHPRFIRSLKWDDPDAKANCFDATYYLYSNNPDEFIKYLKENSTVMKVLELPGPCLPAGR